MSERPTPDKTALRGVDALGRVYDSEAFNFESSRKHLGDTLRLIDSFALLYEDLAEAEVRAEGALREEVSITHLIISCLDHLRLAILSIARGHCGHSAFFTRSAIESCAFAVRMRKFPHLFKEWLDAADDESKYQIYRKKFSGGKIFDASGEAIKALGKRYDACAKHTHPSIVSFHKRFGMKKLPDGRQVPAFNFFDVETDSVAAPVRFLFLTYETHGWIFEALGESLKEELKAQLPDFEQRVRSLATKCQEQWTIWQQLNKAGLPAASFGDKIRLFDV